MGQFLNSREPYDKYRTVILELKVDHTPEEAIAQIKEKEYALRFKGKMAERERYTGRILAVGISYDKETKEQLPAMKMDTAELIEWIREVDRKSVV